MTKQTDDKKKEPKLKKVEKDQLDEVVGGVAVNPADVDEAVEVDRVAPINKDVLCW